jgi:hypothetical protein
VDGDLGAEADQIRLQIGMHRSLIRVLNRHVEPFETPRVKLLCLLNDLLIDFAVSRFQACVAIVIRALPGGATTHA